MMTEAIFLSITRRFAFSVTANIGRAGISLVTGLIVARGLGPENYGNLAYLLGSFWALRALLDMGSSSAFYTFIARQKTDFIYYAVYFFWLAFQFIFSIALITIILPTDIFDRFWLGQQRDIVLLALLANFLQNQVWQTVVQIYEAERQTIRVQLAGLVIVITHLFFVLLLFFSDLLTVSTVLLAIVVEYCIAAFWLSVTARKLFGQHIEKKSAQKNLRTVFSEYFIYCKPMIVIAVFTFFYEMIDRWLLQRFGGASQQGFYQVATQLSTVSLLAATSMLNIFWKEIAEACGQGNSARVYELYQRTTQILLLLAALVSCFLAPWSEQLVSLLLGDEYHAAYMVLFVMLFYPIHQTMGQINGTLFMATGQTRIYMIITVAGLVVGIPVSFVLLAPSSWVFGLDMGAIGLAIKIVGLNIIFVNIQAWFIARHYHGKFSWYYQVMPVMMFIAISYGIYFIVKPLMPFMATIGLSDNLGFLTALMCGGILYLVIVISIIVKLPSFFGLKTADIHSALNIINQKIYSYTVGANK